MGKYPVNMQSSHNPQLQSLRERAHFLSQEINSISTTQHHLGHLISSRRAAEQEAARLLAEAEAKERALIAAEKKKKANAELLEKRQSTIILKLVAKQLPEASRHVTVEAQLYARLSEPITKLAKELKEKHGEELVDGIPHLSRGGVMIALEDTPHELGLKKEKGNEEGDIELEFIKEACPIYVRRNHVAGNDLQMEVLKHEQFSAVEERYREKRPEEFPKGCSCTLRFFGAQVEPEDTFREHDVHPGDRVGWPNANLN
ncbi:unnamed protein product [Chrysoparadoxa australica]